MKSIDIKSEKIAADRRSVEFELREKLPAYAEQVSTISRVLGKAKIRKEGLTQAQRMIVNLGIAITQGSESAIEWSITRALNHEVAESAVEEVIEKCKDLLARKPML